VHHIVEAARRQAESVQRVATYWATASPMMATFLSNHDSLGGRRLWGQLQGDERRMRAAAAPYLLQPGTPFVYYGEPIGPAGLHGPEHGPEGDAPLRAPLSWTADPPTGSFTTGTRLRPVVPNAATCSVEVHGGSRCCRPVARPPRAPTRGGRQR
jgi:glycosidase